MSCPICNRRSEPAYRPFCSRRCADVDLGRWLTGAYAIPTSDESDGEESDAAALDNEPTPPVEGPSPQRKRR